MPNIGFSLQKQYDRPLTQVIPLLHRAGFCAVSPIWSPELDLAAVVACTKAERMAIQSVHAPHKGIPLLWEPEHPQAAAVQAHILRCLDDCARYQIPIMVLHGWQGLRYTFPKEPLDFRFFDRMVQYAQHRGVSVALENLEGEEYLEALMTRYRDLPHIGFCWDSGHDHCYPHRTDFLQAFGHRLIMTHLNDNLGVRNPSGIPSGDDDLHFLPYDGNLDWAHILGRLKDAPRQDILNFEFKTLSHSTAPRDLRYANMPLEAFLAEAGRRARDIAVQYAAVLNTLP
jgi:sugar phosphate isomerase/epimerase